MAWWRRTDPVLREILDDLASVGCHVDSLEAVAGVENPSHEVSRILEKWMRQGPSKYLAELNRARHQVHEKLYPKPPDWSLDELVNIYKTKYPTWHIADEIYKKYSDRVFDDVAQFVMDSKHGKDRQMLALALGKSKRPEAVDVLLSVLDDYSVSGHATEALAKLRSERAREGLTSMLGDDREWVVKQARKGLERLNEQAS